MLDDISESQLAGLTLEARDGPAHALRAMRRIFREKAHAHGRTARFYQVPYTVGGGLALLLAVVLGQVDSCENAELAMVLSLSVALLTTALNFLGIESRLQRHSSSKSQYESLELDLEKFFLTSKFDIDKARDLERSCFDRMKMISAVEPDLSLCCLSSD